jgi:hypothetical protein
MISCKVTLAVVRKCKVSSEPSAARQVTIIIQSCRFDYGVVTVIFTTVHVVGIKHISFGVSRFVLLSQTINFPAIITSILSHFHVLAADKSRASNLYRGFIAQTVFVLSIATLSRKRALARIARLRLENRQPVRITFSFNFASDEDV